MACFVAGIMLAAGVASAATFTWTKSAGGVFSTAGNWKTNNVAAVVAPGANDMAQFSLGSATRAKVTFNSAVTTTTTNLSFAKSSTDNKYEFSIADGAGSAVYDAGYTRFCTSWNFRADVLISTGKLISSQVNIEGYDARANIVLDGPGTIWSIQDFFCTQQATVNIDIQNGAKMEALAKNGGLNARGNDYHRIDLDSLDSNRALVSHFRVTGPGSSAVFSGSNTTFNSNCEALMEFSDGAYGSFRNLSIGSSDTNYTPRVVVSNATLETALFKFDSFSGLNPTKGTLLVTAGATMTSKGSAYLDGYMVKVVTATVDNATWNIGGTELRVGQDGECMLIVTNGGQVVGTNAVGNMPNTSNKLTVTNQIVVTGSGSVLKLRGLYAGGPSWDNFSPGRIFVNNGGSVVQTDSAANKFTIWSNGVLNLDGGTVSNASRLNVTGRLEGRGTVVSNVLVDASYSRVSPGNAIGQLNIGGSYTQSLGRLEIQLNGTTPGTGYDVMAVTGKVAFTGGTIAVTTQPGFNLPGGISTFDIVTAGNTLTTNGVTVSLPSGGANWSAQVVATAGGNALRVTAAKAAAGALIMLQ